MISWLEWLVGLFGVFVWPFHGYREVCCMVFLTGHWEWLFGVLADATAADHSRWKFLPLKPVNFFWKYPPLPLPPKEKAFLLLVSQKAKLKMLKSSAFFRFSIARIRPKFQRKFSGFYTWLK
jgi:hypothetical protein